MERRPQPAGVNQPEQHYMATEGTEETEETIFGLANKRSDAPDFDLPPMPKRKGAAPARPKPIS